LDKKELESNTLVSKQFKILTIKTAGLQQAIFFKNIINKLIKIIK